MIKINQLLNKGRFVFVRYAIIKIKSTPKRDKSTPKGRFVFVRYAIIKINQVLKGLQNHPDCRPFEM